ncbi:MAG TPA: Uma2 family endonuclease [Herpetosiphonaceae bacterium]|nr:Uma2 family endonuclease [Herpetosiphonaceae bacterium]
MATELRWTTADLELMPDDGKRYEIVDGELYVSTQPHYYHQYACGRIYLCLENWNDQTHAGQAIQVPGLIFGENDDVAPDVIWISNERLQTALAPDGKLHAAPELVVEVLSPGSTNERRDREVKLKLYSRRGVLEYWIVDWRQRQVEVYRRKEAALSLVATLYEKDELRSPLLPGFACDVRRLFPATS